MPHPDLTAAFHDARLLCSSDFASLNERFALTAGSRHVILIRMTVSETKVIGALVAVVLLSAFIGVGALLLTEDAQVGFGVTAAVVGFVAVVQMAALGMDSLRDK